MAIIGRYMLGTLHVNYEVDFNFKSTTAEAKNIIKKSQNFLTSST